MTNVVGVPAHKLGRENQRLIGVKTWDELPPPPEFADNRAELEARLKGKICIRLVPDQVDSKQHDPFIAKGETEFYLRCMCYPKPPLLGPSVWIVKERLGDMVTQAIARRGDEAAQLAVADVKKYLDVGRATDAEIELFLRFCVAEELNPLVGDAYLIKYQESKPASIVIGLSTFIRRADAHPAYDGYESGVVVQKQGKAEFEYRDGSLILDGETLAGAWCKALRKDRKDPKLVTVSFREYDKGQANWREKPGTMIEKVAIVQAFRRTYPNVESVYSAARAEGLSITVDEPDEDRQAEDIEAAADSLYGPSEEAAPEADPDTGEILEPEQSSPTPQADAALNAPDFKNLGDFMQAATVDLGIQPAEVRSILGVETNEDILFGDLAQWQKVVAARKS